MTKYIVFAIVSLLSIGCAKSSTAPAASAASMKSNWSGEFPQVKLDLSKFSPTASFLATWTDTYGQVCQSQVSVSADSDPLQHDPDSGTLTLSGTTALQAFPGDVNCSTYDGTYDYNLLESQGLLLCRNGTCNEFVAIASSPQG